jgi:metal-sulfur cluster biosynthetic enzyme
MTNSSNNDSKASNADDSGVHPEQDPIILDIIQALDSVPDPCCVLSGKDLSILDLGLINRIERDGDTVVIGVTLTDTMCEFSHKIFSDIESLADVVPDVAKVNVVPEVLPIWSPDRLSERAVSIIRDDSSRFFRNWDLEKASADNNE